MGNERAKAFFEANVPASYSVPREHATVREREKWIRDKYEHRRFVARDPPPSREKKAETSSGSRSSRQEMHIMTHAGERGELREGGVGCWMERVRKKERQRNKRWSRESGETRTAGRELAAIVRVGRKAGVHHVICVH